METQSSSLSQRSVASNENEEGPAFYTPSGTPPQPLDVPARRRPQEIPERLKPASRDGPDQNALPLSKPTPPPTSSLPPPPTEVPEPTPVEELAVQQPEASATEVLPAQPAESPAPGEDKTAATVLNTLFKKTALSTAGATETANKFRRAAAAAGAFKPRAGGAAAKMFAKETKKSDEPDGITGVFVPKRPAPVEASKEEAIEKAEDASRPASARLSRERPHIDTEVVPSVTVSSPLTPVPAIIEPQSGPATEETARARSPEKLVAKTPKASADPEPRKKKRRSNQQVMNINKLGIDAGIMDDRGLSFEYLLEELGWGGTALAPKPIEALEIDIKREIARVEAGSWLNHLEQKDDRVEAVERMLDRAIAECDELEGLLTLYNVELSVS